MAFGSSCLRAHWRLFTRRLPKPFCLDGESGYFHFAGLEQRTKRQADHRWGRLGRLCAVTTGLIYLQAIFGAVLRHTGKESTPIYSLPCW